jgi:hypothetical protein
VLLFNSPIYTIVKREGHGIYMVCAMHVVMFFTNKKKHGAVKNHIISAMIFTFRQAPVVQSMFSGIFNATRMLNDLPRNLENQKTISQKP